MSLSGGGALDGITVSGLGTVNITGGTLTLTDPAEGINATEGTLEVSGGTVNASAGNLHQPCHWRRASSRRQRPRDHLLNAAHAVVRRWRRDSQRLETARR